MDSRPDQFIGRSCDGPPYNRSLPAAQAPSVSAEPAVAAMAPERRFRSQSTPVRDRRGELGVLAVYFALVVVLADALNVRLGVELLTLMAVGAGVIVTRRPIDFLRDWWFLLIGLVMWNLSGPIAARSPFPWHLDFMLAFDRALFLGRDPVYVVQHAFWKPQHIGPLEVASSVVYNMHLAEPYIAGYFLWRLNRSLFFQFAAATLVLLVLGLVTFILFPAVPPWLAAKEFGKVVGVKNLFSQALLWHPLSFHGSPIFTLFKLRGDLVAAFPSEHAAFPLLELLAFYGISKRTAWFFVPWIAAVTFSVVYLGEHWVADVVAGWLYALVIWFAIRAIVRAAGAHMIRRLT